MSGAYKYSPSPMGKPERTYSAAEVDEAKRAAEEAQARWWLEQIEWWAARIAHHDPNCSCQYCNQLRYARSHIGNTDALDRALATARDAERERCATIAENPYSDEVDAYGYDEPSVVGRKIAAAIRGAV